MLLPRTAAAALGCCLALLPRATTRCSAGWAAVTPRPRARPPLSQLSDAFADEGADADADAVEAMAEQSWGDESFDDPGWADPGGAPVSSAVPLSPGAAAEWLSTGSDPRPQERRPARPIEAVKVGWVNTQFRRRNGYHVEVRVQHGADAESVHKLWVSHEVRRAPRPPSPCATNTFAPPPSQVMIETAARREKEEWDLTPGDFSEAVVGYLQDAGVDLADPDWAMDDRSVPFSSQYFKVRVNCLTRPARAIFHGARATASYATAPRRCARSSTTTPTCARRSPPSCSTEDAAVYDSSPERY